MHQASRVKEAQAVLGTGIGDNCHLSFQICSLVCFLISAAALGSLKCIEILHENGAKIDARDQNNQTPFHQAVAAGQTDCAKLFISFGAKVAAQDKRLRCCVHLAVEQGREETLSMLLSETGSDLVNMPDHKQRTSLHHASYADDPKVLLDILTDFKTKRYFLLVCL